MVYQGTGRSHSLMLVLMAILSLSVPLQVRGPKNPDEPIPKWALEADERPTPAEEVALGLRRGRSYRDASLAAGWVVSNLVVASLASDPEGSGAAAHPSAQLSRRRIGCKCCATETGGPVFHAVDV